MKIIKLISLLVLFGIVANCSGVSEALGGKKRSNNSDEFLVEKKNPLVLPPDFEKMPKPKNIKEETAGIEDEDIIKNILGQKKITDLEIKNSESGSLEQSILKKINAE